MKLKSETVVFFGSGPVAARSLEFLAGHFNIELVVTKPRRSGHKGPVPVLDLAEKFKLPTLQAATKAELLQKIQQQPLHSRLGVLIDYGIIIQQDVIDLFPLGIINSHFSLLPTLRGADPITFSILEGHRQTGVSLMLVTQKMDEGPLLVQKSLELTKSHTATNLTDELITLSNNLLLYALPAYISDKLKPFPQLVSTRQPISYSRKLTKDDGQIDWSHTASQIERQIRAFIEWPKSHANIGKTSVIITKAEAEAGKPIAAIGQPRIDIDGKLKIATSSGNLVVRKLKPAGKAEMSAADFINGYKHLLGEA